MNNSRLEQSLNDLLATISARDAEIAELKAKEPPLLQCVLCRNTESCAGAMARAFNHGLCLRCGGPFRVVRA